MSFRDPLAFLLLLPLAVLLVSAKGRREAIIFPALADLAGMPVTLKQRFAALLPWMRTCAIVLAVVALARPQMVNTTIIVKTKGVDIVISLDLSTSMLAVDRNLPLHRSRLDMAKDVVREFITRRTGDRIALVAFAARPFPVAPLTLDHAWLSGTLDTLSPAVMEDGTAIGDGLLAALNRLSSAPVENRTVILLTDGRSNTGQTKPETAAAAARALGVKVHTVGIGSKGKAEFPIEDPLGGTVWREVEADLDEAILQDVATTTGGRYFRADDTKSLRAIFGEIDKLEKRTVVETRRKSIRELFFPVLLAAFLLFLAEQSLRATWLRSIP